MVVGSINMCASYAVGKRTKGFCLLEGTQCFTSKDFLQAYDAADQADCAAKNVMECYEFTNSSSRRMTTEEDHRRAEAGDIGDVSLEMNAVYFLIGIYVHCYPLFTSIIFELSAYVSLMCLLACADGTRLLGRT